jgi:hypothetical protein
MDASLDESVSTICVYVLCRSQVGILGADNDVRFCDSEGGIGKANGVPSETDNLCVLSSRDNAAAMQALLQEDSDLLDRIYMSDDMAGLLALVRPDVECYRCKGAHYKWQCTAIPSPQE